MRVKKLLLLALSFLCLTVFATFSGCSNGEQDLDGMYIVEFQLNGGLLDKGSTLVSEMEDNRISHAYHPNSLAIDISNFKNYSLQKNGFVFEGWYLDENFTDKWDFANDRVTKDCTLYAKWEKAIVYSYSVILVDENGEQTTLGTYTVKEGAAFSDNTKKYTTKVLQEEYGKTCIGLYSDADLSEDHIWNADYQHPGGEADTDIPVYVRAIDGIWSLVGNADDLKAVAAQNKNIYLLNDIDYQGQELYFRDYNSVFNGNGYTIFNAKIKEQGETRNRKYSLFGVLGESSKIYDVTFADVKFEFDAYEGQTILASALAQGAEEGFEVSNVTVRGSYTVADKAAELLDTAKLNQALFDPTNQTAENVKNFTATIEAQENDQP